MRFVFRKRPAVKAVCYTALLLALLLFSSSFFPALRLSVGTPNLLLTGIALLACFEGVEYAAIFAVVFGALEAHVLGESILFLPLFYALFALGCARLFRGTVARKYWIWLLLLLGGQLLYAALGLFPAVARWQVSALRLLDRKMGASLLLSLLFALPLYPLFLWVSKKTDL